MLRRANVSSRQSASPPTVTTESFSGDPASPGIVVLGAHYVSEEEDAADSDSNRLRQLLLSTSVGRFCGVTYGDMVAQPGFFKHNFKPGLPDSDVEIVCLDYFWMQRGGDWIKMRYGNNWRAKIACSFSRCPQLKVFLVPKVSELFDCTSVNALANEFGSGAPPLLLSGIDAEEAESLHPLVVATIDRDCSQSPHMGRWETEGRVHSLQISSYAPDGFLAVHRFANNTLLCDYLRAVCISPPLAHGAPPPAPLPE